MLFSTITQSNVIQCFCYNKWLLCMMDASALQSLPPRWLTFSQISPILPQFGEWTSQTCHKQDGSEVEEQNLDFQRPHPKILNPAQGRKEKHQDIYQQ